MKNFTILTTCTLLFFLGTSYIKAQGVSNSGEWVYENWYTDKEKVFELAKEQDKLIFLFFGLNGCDYCAYASYLFSDTKNSLASTIAENYIPWAYKTYSNNITTKITDLYVHQLINYSYDKGLFTRFPALILIDPEFPDSIFKSLDGKIINPDPAPPTPDYVKIEGLRNLITVDLLSGSELTWYKDKSEVFTLAKAQNKFIFKLVGRGTSPNSQKVMQQLNEVPLKQLLENNYILWYSVYEPETTVGVELLSGKETVLTLPYISIIYPEEPEIELASEGGYQDVETLEDLLKTYTVSNEKILSENKVTFSDNTLRISNQTNNERIQVFTITGQRIASVSKNDYNATIDASYFPKGILIIHSSKGWSAKIVKQ